MLILSFAHSLTGKQLERAKKISGKLVDEARDLRDHFNKGWPIVPQTVAPTDACNLAPHVW